LHTTGRGDKPASIWRYVTAVDLKIFLFSAMCQPYWANEVHDHSYRKAGLRASLSIIIISCRGNASQNAALRIPTDRTDRGAQLSDRGVAYALGSSSSPHKLDSFSRFIKGGKGVCYVRGIS